MDYNKLLSRSWNIVWRNKALWLLGFMASLAAGGGRAGNSYSSGNGEMSPEMLTTIGVTAVLLSFLVFIISIAIWGVSTVARGGLIGSVALLDDDDSLTLTVGESIQPGLSAFWRIIGIGVLLSLPFILLFGVMTVIMFVMVGGTAVLSAVSENSGDFDALFSTLGTMISCFVFFLCLLFPIGITVQLVQAFAVRGTVLRDFGIVESIQHGWDIVRQNIGEILLLGLLFFGIGIIYGIGIGILMIPVAFIMIAPMVGSMMNGEAMSMITIFWSICSGIVTVLLGAALSSILTAWRSAAFTLAYKKFTSKTVDAGYEKPPSGADFDTSFETEFEPKWREE